MPQSTPTAHQPSPTPPPSIAPSTKAPSLAPSSGLPVRLRIARLNIDTKIAATGLNSAGEMAVPASVTETGWYQYGAYPGNTGSAVIAGHLDSLSGQDGVFINLHKLAVGDEIEVTDIKGQVSTFKVRRSQTYDQNARPEEVFISSQGSHLNLITCIGAWSKTQKRYAERLVVFADKI